VKNHALALLVVSLMCWLIAVGSLKAGEVNTLVRKGQRIGVWGYMCKDTICSDNVCLTLQYSDHQPARAIISIEATWMTDADKPIEVTGHYCTPKKTRTYFMTYAVFVEAIDGDLYASYTANPLDK
jgi:hypothetical protein